MANSTALASGLIMAHLLRGITDVELRPVYCAQPNLAPAGPAISYYRSGIRSEYAKTPAAKREATVVVCCYHPDYGGSVALAERVLEAVEGKSGRIGDLVLSSATLEDASEDFRGDKATQIMTFKLTINPYRP